MSEHECISRIGTGKDNKAFVIYLSNGLKITVGRDKTTKGSAWLEISQQAVIKPATKSNQ